MLLAVLANVFQFGGRFVLGWCVLRGFGIQAGFWDILVLHVLLQYLLYFMPTPGGSGIGELLVSALMSPFLPARMLVAYAAVWRVFLSYVTVSAGGGVLLRWLSTDSRRSGGRSPGQANAAGDLGYAAESIGEVATPARAGGKVRR